VPRPVVITGGGTGGHVFAMQAIAEALTRAGVAPARLRYVGSSRGQDAQLLGAGPIHLTLLAGRGLRRSATPRDVASNLLAVGALAGAILRSVALVARWRPALVVSVGGYASFPVSFVTAVLGRRLVLVELDAAPGAAHRLLARRASARCLAFADGSDGVVTGAPVREAIADVARDAAAREASRRSLEPPIDATRRVVVVMTGSLGSARVNAAVVELARLWSDRADRTILHVTGRRDYEWVRDARVVSELDYRVHAFADMAQLWSVADVAVCRAGATTVAELTTLGIAAILVPLPRAPGDHQIKNARSLADAGAAVLVSDADCTGATLAHALDELLANARADDVGAAARSLGHLDAAAAIAAVVARVGGLA
jgi:UDP-N-acetylglucosamine--N-acetylmuramyl-(pentapeptide) pyrophosphoryl-undecaprenol N-acetylglucosamine transferase